MEARTCGECEFFGNFVEMLFSPEWAETKTTGGMPIYYHPFIGFDELRGAGCECKNRRPQNVRIYLNTPACGYFKPKNWTRPESCSCCALLYHEKSDGSISCSGWPFSSKKGRDPCQNGRAYYGENLKLF